MSKFKQRTFAVSDQNLSTDDHDLKKMFSKNFVENTSKILTSYFHSFAKKEWVQETILNVSGYLFLYKLDFELIWNLLIILLKYFLLNNDADNVPAFLKYKFLKNWIIFPVLFVKSKNIIILTTSCGTPPNSQKLFLSLENP